MAITPAQITPAQGSPVGAIARIIQQGDQQIFQQVQAARQATQQAFENTFRQIAFNAQERRHRLEEARATRNEARADRGFFEQVRQFDENFAQNERLTRMRIDAQSRSDALGYAQLAEKQRQFDLSRGDVLDFQADVSGFLGGGGGSIFGAGVNSSSNQPLPEPAAPDAGPLGQMPIGVDPLGNPVAAPAGGGFDPANPAANPLPAGGSVGGAELLLGAKPLDEGQSPAELSMTGILDVATRMPSMNVRQGQELANVLVDKAQNLNALNDQDLQSLIMAAEAGTGHASGLSGTAGFALQNKVAGGLPVEAEAAKLKATFEGVAQTARSELYGRQRSQFSTGSDPLLRNLEAQLAAERQRLASLNESLGLAQKGEMEGAGTALEKSRDLQKGITASENKILGLQEQVAARRAVLANEFAGGRPGTPPAGTPIFPPGGGTGGGNVDLDSILDGGQ